MKLSFKYYRTDRLVGVILAIAVLIESYVAPLAKPYMAFLQSCFDLQFPSTAAILGVLLYLYDKWLWKWPVFNQLVTVPDISGRYETEIIGSSGNAVGFLEIVQRASGVSVKSYSFNDQSTHTNSKTDVAEIVAEPDGTVFLYSHYSDDGAANNNDLHPHKGASILKFIPASGNNPKRFEGRYFTNRTPTQTKGEYNAKWISNELQHSF